METKTAEAKQGEVLSESNELARREVGTGLAPFVLTPELVQLIKTQVCPAGIPENDFRFFLEKCRQTGMNPILGEAFCVKRGQYVQQGDREVWVEQFVFQPAEHGMEVRAHRAGDFLGISGAAVCEKDVCEIDTFAKKVIHRFDPTKPRGKIVGAWALAVRAGHEPQLAWCLFDEYAQRKKDKTLTKMWAEKGLTMIAKVPRAQVLRLLYPFLFEGNYTEEEFASITAQRDVVDAERSSRTVDAGLANLKTVVKAKAEETRAPPASPPAQVERPPASPPQASAPATEKAPEPEKKKPAPVLPLAIDLAVWRFGEKKGALLTQASGVELEEAREKLAANLKANPKASEWRDNALAQMAELAAELAAREEAAQGPQGEPAPEPGAEG